MPLHPQDEDEPWTDWVQERDQAGHRRQAKGGRGVPATWTDVGAHAVRSYWQATAVP